MTKEEREYLDKLWSIFTDESSSEIDRINARILIIAKLTENFKREGKEDGK